MTSSSSNTLAVKSPTSGLVDQKARLTSVSSTELGETLENTTDSEKNVRENVPSDENKKGWYIPCTTSEIKVVCCPLIVQSGI